MDEMTYRGCLRGDTAAQREFHDELAPRMYGVALRYVKDEDDAKDVLQDAFVRAFTHFKELRSPDKATAWLHSIVVRTALNFMRKNRLEFISVDDAPETDMPSDISMSAFDRLSLNDLLAMLNSLPNGYKTVFNLHYIDGYSHTEIAQILGCTDNTSKSQARRARNALANMINATI